MVGGDDEFFQHKVHLELGQTVVVDQSVQSLLVVVSFRLVQRTSSLRALDFEEFVLQLDQVQVEQRVYLEGFGLLGFGHVLGAQHAFIEETTCDCFSWSCGGFGRLFSKRVLVGLVLC